MKINLSARQPFQFSSVVGSHGWVRLVPFIFDDNNDTLLYTHRLDSGMVVDLCFQDYMDGVTVIVDTQLTEAELEQVTLDVTWMLNLDADLSGFYKLARNESKLDGVEARAQGRLLRSPTLYEDVIKTILTTNTAWGGTIRMNNALVSHFGDSLPGNMEHKAFPTPFQLAKTNEGTLRSQVKLGYRSSYVFDLARAVDSGEVNVEELKNVDIPTSELRKRLLSIKGVGEYAAANLLMILGRYDYLPVDSWGVKMVSHEWYGGEPVGKKEVEAAFERWGEYKGLAYWFWDWEYLHKP
jgi:3-methyladenine DNA glycosylase/8-oxoguanine DNA glycosylase